MAFSQSHPQLYAAIKDRKFHIGQVREIASLLPREDAELDGLIGQVVSERDSNTFHLLVIAALLEKRVVDSRHLIKGTALLSNIEWVPCLAWKMQGEVADHLVAGVQQMPMPQGVHAMALLTAAVWSKQHREGRMPGDLISEARLLAHRKKLDADTLANLIALSQIADNPTFASMILREHPSFDRPDHLELARKIAETVVVVGRREVISMIPQKPDRVISAGSNVRRAVARVGRNDPCPCGSGKKYKRCCEHKDRERMMHSSNVPGMTRGEVAEEIEKHLTEAQIKTMLPRDLARLDVTKLHENLLAEYFIRLGAFKMVEEAVTAMEKLECEGEEHAEVWDYISLFVISKQRLDVAQRLVKLRYKDGDVPETVRFGFRLLLARDEPARCLELIEKEAKSALTSDNPDQLYRFAHGLTSSPYAALGIHCARSLIPFIKKATGISILDEVQRARDRLNLPSEEPMAELLEKRFADEVADRGKDASELRKARERLDAKIGEVNELKENLEKLRREIRLQEKKAPQATSTQPAAEPKELRDLREKVRELKSSITARNEERAMFRRELGQAYSDLEALRAQKAAEPTGNDVPKATSVDAEDALLLPGDIDSNQPPRPIEFPKKFHDTLASLPRQIGRAALIHIGRIAAGDPTAFAGAIRLKAAPDVMRVRIGHDHRMLFRLLPECVQLVSLINRRDLERTIESL